MSNTIPLPRTPYTGSPWPNIYRAEDMQTYAAAVSAADNAAMRVEVAGLRADAERYRWLRNNPEWLGWDHDFRPDEVEREIDAARKGEA